MSAPLVVNTKDGTCWTRRTVTSGGLALYAPESVKTCPRFVMATIEELVEHGIVGSADALPMPVPSEPQDDPITRGRGLDLLELMDERAASVVSPVLAAVLDEAERLRSSRWDATKVVAQLESKLLAMHGELTRATERVAELEAERHSTNEPLSEAAEQLRANRDRITELETARGLVCRECAAPVRWVENPNGGWWNHTGPASDGHGVYPRPAVALPADTYPPALPWARLMDDDDLIEFLTELAGVMQDARHMATLAGHVHARRILDGLEKTCGTWRLIAEAQYAHNTAPGPDTEAPTTETQALRAEDTADLLTLAPAQHVTAELDPTGDTILLEMTATREQWSAWQTALKVDLARTTNRGSFTTSHATWRGIHVVISRWHAAEDGDAR